MPIRIDLAYKSWVENQGKGVSVRKIAHSHGVVLSTLQGRIKGGMSRVEANQAMQILCPGEEDAIEQWMLQMAV